MKTTLYVSTGCTACKPIKELLSRFNIEHEIHNVTDMGNPLELRGVPVLARGDTLFHGTDAIMGQIRKIMKGE